MTSKDNYLAEVPPERLRQVLEALAKDTAWRITSMLWGERRVDTRTQSGADNADKACDEVCTRIHAHVAPSLRSLAEAMDIPVPDAPEERGHKWSDAAIVAAMDAPPCKSEKVSNPRVCGYCTRNMLSAALAVDFPALVSAAAPEERDGELDDLLREYRDLVAEQEARVADHTEALEASLADIRAYVATAKREAREAGRAALYALARRWEDNARDAREHGWHSVGLKYQECAMQLRVTLADGPRAGEGATRFEYSADEQFHEEQVEQLAGTAPASGAAPDAGTGERVPRYACRACDFTTNYEKLSQEHHDATGHNMRWTRRDATSEELAHDIRGTAPAPGDATGETASGETASGETALDEARFKLALLSYGQEPSDLYFDQAVRLYRAAAGEVVGTATASGAAPEERDGELSRLLNDMQAACYDHAKGHDHGNPLDCAQCQHWVQDVQQLVAQRERAAREAGRAEMGEVVLADDEMVERVAKAMHNRAEAPLSIFWQQWETQPEFNRQCARRWVKDVLTTTQSVLREDLVRRRGKEEG